VMPVFLDLDKSGIVTAPALTMLTKALLTLRSDPQATAEATVLKGLADATMALFHATGEELRRRDHLVARALQGEPVDLPWLDPETVERARSKSTRKQTAKKRRRPKR
jgi:hypothetical protein